MRTHADEFLLNSLAPLVEAAGMKNIAGPAIDEKTFEKLKRIAPHMLASHRDAVSGESRTRPLPEEIAFKLTNRCDLRCTHCYQWNEDGYHHHLSSPERRGDLDLAVIAKLLEATRQLKSNVYLWGGEPLVYRDWDGLVELLVEDPRWTSICTNGTLIGKRLDSLKRISSHLEVSVSLDGFEADHDAIRGKGAFQRTMSGFGQLLEEKAAGRFHGETTVNFVITDAMVNRIFDFAHYIESLGIDTLYVSYPWYISNDTSARMNAYYAEHYGWETSDPRRSWDSYKYRLDPAMIGDLSEQIAKLEAASWRLKVRYNPALSAGELPAFVGGSHQPAQNKTQCQSIRTRMDVFPDGQVVSCKFFPEFRMGDLSTAEVADIWEGERYKQVRDTIARCGLMPICAKCNLLYTRGM